EQAAGARAARPTAAAKAAAWAAVVDTDTLPNATQRVVCRSFWQRGQDAVLAPYVDRYFRLCEDISAGRGGWAEKGTALRTTGLRVADVAALLDHWYPPGLAESWDVVGSSAGSRDAAVTRILLAVEPAAVVVSEAARGGADLLVTHHPLLLHGISTVETGTPK